MLRFALTSLRRGALWLADLVLPPRCPGCGATVVTQGTFCAPCWGSLRFLEAGEGCASCGEPAGASAIAFDGWRCGRCLAEPPPFVRAQAAFVYGGAIRRAILGFKHRDRSELAAMLARHMARAAPDLMGAADGAEGTAPLLVPVPLHRWRLWRRGYNQAALLARALARQTGADFMPDALERVRMTPSQQGLSRAARLRNLKGAFRVPKRQRGRIRGRAVVLIDDVLTTGSTAQRCTQALLKAGAGQVRVLTLARVAAVALDAGGSAGAGEGAGPRVGVAGEPAAIHID